MNIDICAYSCNNSENYPGARNVVIRVGIAGASGYVGGELLRLLLGHPEVEIGTLAGASSAGTLVEQHHPHLVPLAGRKIESLSGATFAADDVVLLALPHGHSAAIASALPSTKLVLDCGADFRLADPDAWTRFYGGEHAGFWPYGLPELPGARQQLSGARRIAVPGCYPTASALAIWPALANGLIEPDVVIVAASGTSGAGREPKPQLMGSEVMGAMSAYGVGGVHRHVPEIREIFETVAGQPVSVSFTPTLAPMSRGILATCVATLKDDFTDDVVRAAYEAAYESEPCVNLLATGQWPSTAATLGSNVAHLQVSLDLDANRLVAICAIDNLVKGTAGQALQCMNLAMGIPETTGIPFIGLAP
jgi:N-acetyl-gamma-glutamyl-phosphate reductase